MFFLELPCFFDDRADVGNLISGSSAFSKTSLNIWKFMVHVLLKPGLENFEHYLALPFSGIGMKADLFQSCGTAEFSKFAGILSAALSQHHLSGCEIAQLEFHHLLSCLSLLFFGTMNSNGNIFPFLLCFLLLFFSQLFVRPPQTVILLFCISFPWGWS